MKLSARLVAWHLNKMWETGVCGSLSCEPVLKYATYYSPGMPIEEGVLYVTDRQDFFVPKEKWDRLLLVAAGGSGYAECPNVCRIPAGNCPDILNALHQIFDRYERWNQSLVDSRLQNDSVQALIDLSAPVIPNPLSVIGMDFRVIADKDMDGRALRQIPLGADEQTAALVNALKQDRNYQEALQRVGYFYYPGNEIAGPSLCVNIRRSDQTVYRLLMPPGELPLDDTFGFILENLAKMIAHALSTNVRYSHQMTFPLHQIFDRLLSDPGTDYVEVSQHLTNLGWSALSHYQCIFIKTGILDMKNMTLRSICSFLENTVPGSCAVEYRGDVVVFVNLELCRIPEEEIPKRLETFLRESLLRAGFSRVLHGHFNFYRQYLQAAIALDLGKQRDPVRCVCLYNDVALDYLLQQATKKLPGYMVCHEKLLKLKYGQDESGAHLYQTLRCYLNNHLSITKTAQALFIHRSTLLYRLKRIEEIMGCDYADPDELLYLMLSFRIMDAEEET